MFLNVYFVRNGQNSKVGPKPQASSSPQGWDKEGDFQQGTVNTLHNKAFNKYSKFEYIFKKTGQGQVTGVTLAQCHLLLKVKRNKNCGRCRWQREKQNGRKFRAQLGSRESGLDSKQHKKPHSEILGYLDFGQKTAKMWSLEIKLYASYVSYS